MNILYFTADGQAIIEKSSVNSRYIEMRDGYHPITNDSVWQDDKRLRPPVMAIFEGVLGPLGSDMTEEDVISILTEVELIKMSFRAQSVSKMWMRAFIRMGQWIVRWGFFLLIGLFITYFLVQGMMGAA